MIVLLTELTVGSWGWKAEARGYARVQLSEEGVGVYPKLPPGLDEARGR